MSTTTLDEAALDELEQYLDGWFAYFPERSGVFCKRLAALRQLRARVRELEADRGEITREVAERK